jgi:hypothetical protein
MVAPVRKRNRNCHAQAQQTTSAFKHFRPINRNWQLSTTALLQSARKVAAQKRAKAQFFKNARAMFNNKRRVTRLIHGSRLHGLRKFNRSY